MERFGEFVVLEPLGRSDVADRYKVMHDTLGGPFFVKRYTRLPADHLFLLHERCERLMGVEHASLASHLGHGETEGIPFVVSPYLEGLDLEDFIRAWRARRAPLKLEALLYIVQGIARGVDALHALSQGEQGASFAHGDVSARHVRLGSGGQIWLTGLTTPRILVPGVSPEPRWDTAGAAAACYDLWPLTRQGLARLPPTPDLEEVLRAFLGMADESNVPPPAELAAHLALIAGKLRQANFDPAALVDLVERARRELGRLLPARPADGVARPDERESLDGGADALPTLEPVPVAASAVPPAPSSSASSPQPAAGSPPRRVPREISMVTAAPVPAVPADGAPAVSAVAAVSAAAAVSAVAAQRRLPDEGPELDHERGLVVLLERQRLTPADVARVRAAQADDAAPLLLALIREGSVEPALAAQTLAEAAGVVLHDERRAGPLAFDAERCAALPQALLRTHALLPLAGSTAQRLRLAVADPFDQRGIEEAARALGAPLVERVVCEAPALALRIESALAQGEGASARPSPAPRPPAQARILLTTAREDLSLRIGERLAKEGMSVSHAREVSQGRALFDAEGADALLVAPERYGDPEAAWVAALRAADASLPVFVMCAVEDEAGAARALEDGADDVLTLPLNLTLLVAKVRRACQRRHDEGAPPAALPHTATRGAAADLDPFAAGSGAAMHFLSPVPTGVMGSLRQMPVTDLVQSLENGKKSAVIEVHPTRGESGRLGFVDGQVVFARCGELRGEAAFYALAPHQEGFFRVRYGELPQERNIESATMFLLLEAMRLMDEQSGSPLEEIPSVDDVELLDEPNPFDS